MNFAITTLRLDISGPGLHEITGLVENWCVQQPQTEGLLTLFLPHTSASLLIQENADPDVCADLENFFATLVPHTSHYQHAQEGPDDMPAHIRSALTQTHLSIPLIRGNLALGTWQGIYLFEHRDRPRQRSLHLHLAGSERYVGSQR